MTFKTDDRVFETSITTGTGDYTLEGAQVGFNAFSAMGANNLCPYFATDDVNWEVGIGTILTGPARLQRTAILRSSNADAAVNWAAGTRKLRCGLPAAMAIPRTLSKSVAGSSDVALTQNEQRRDQLVFTGALTGNINVTVDATPWRWSVYNNTSGAYTLKLKTVAGVGMFIPQGGRALLECDGTDVVVPGPNHVFTSAAQTGSNDGVLTIAHGLGKRPEAIECWAECLTAEYNYTVGMRVILPAALLWDGSSYRGQTISADGTNIRVRFGASGGFIVMNNNGGGGNGLTHANWALYYKAWAR